MTTTEHLISHGFRTIEQCRDLVASVIYRATPEAIDAIAKACHAAEHAGENCSVWHQSALYYGSACQCAVCRPFMGRK